MTAEMNGEQMVEVRADGFRGDYPWNGTHTLNLSFPLEDGAMVEGEGGAFVLHLSKYTRSLILQYVLAYSQ